MINGRKVLGIIGGMGPLATADLYRKIILLTDARSDSEHIHVLIDGNTQVPDRTRSILSGDNAPLGPLSESARRLEAAGADLLVMSCNAAHYYHAALSKACGIPILNMVAIAAQEAKERGFRRVGLLAVDGVLRSGIYDAECEKRGVSVVRPNAEGQRQVMHLIYDEVKAGNSVGTAMLDEALADMAARGAEAFILGCTELPLAFAGYTAYPLIDPTKALALEAIRTLGYPTLDNI